MPEIHWSQVNDMPGVKEATVCITPEMTLRVAVVVGLADAKKYANAFKQNKVRHDFVEVMGCFPAGCISGGGQPPVGKNKDIIETRRNALDAFDDKLGAHDNPWIEKLYKEHLGEPMGDRAHELLHVHEQNI